MRCYIIILFLLASQFALAQATRYGKMKTAIPKNAGNLSDINKGAAFDGEWREGSILVNDGSELKGLVRFDDNQGILSFQSGNDSRSFLPRNVMGFEFYDTRQSKQRVFYSIQHADPATGIIAPLFFEVIRELKDFAVLSKVDPIAVEERRYSSSPSYVDSYGNIRGSGNSRNVISQTETVYFMDKKGEILPFAKTVSRIIDGSFQDRFEEKNKVLDKDLLERFIGKEMREKLEAHAKANDLKFNVKEDLVVLLDYYATLLK